MSEEILAVIEVAALLRVADRTVLTLAQQGELRVSTVRGQRRFPRTGIDAWTASQRARTTKKLRQPKGARR